MLQHPIYDENKHWYWQILSISRFIRPASIHPNGANSSNLDSISASSRNSGDPKTKKQFATWMFLTIPPRKLVRPRCSETTRQYLKNTGTSAVNPRHVREVYRCETNENIQNDEGIQYQKQNRIIIYTNSCIYIYVNHKYTYDLYYVYFPSTLQMDK